MTDSGFWVFLLQLVRECKEVLKGGLLMKQYYQFMLREVLDDLQKIDCNIDAFEEDLHKMLMVSFKTREGIWSSTKSTGLNNTCRCVLFLLRIDIANLLLFCCINMMLFF